MLHESGSNVAFDVQSVQSFLPETFLCYDADFLDTFSYNMEWSAELPFR